MIPVNSRKELEDRLEECIEVFTANKDSLVELNAGDVVGFRDILNTVDEEVEAMVDSLNQANISLAEGS